MVEAAKAPFLGGLLLSFLNISIMGFKLRIIVFFPRKKGAIDFISFFSHLSTISGFIVDHEAVSLKQNPCAALQLN